MIFKAIVVLNSEGKYRWWRFNKFVLLSLFNFLNHFLKMQLWLIDPCFSRLYMSAWKAGIKLKNCAFTQKFYTRKIGQTSAFGEEVFCKTSIGSWLLFGLLTGVFSFQKRKISVIIELVKVNFNVSIAFC